MSSNIIYIVGLVCTALGVVGGWWFGRRKKTPVTEDAPTPPTPPVKIDLPQTGTADITTEVEREKLEIEAELSLDDDALARDIYERNRASEAGTQAGDNS